FLSDKLIQHLRLKLEAIETHQFQAVLRADIDASAAQDTEAAVFEIPFEYGVDPAVQAALRFDLRGFFVQNQLNFGRARAAVQRHSRNRLPDQVQQVRRHAVPP